MLAFRPHKAKQFNISEDSIRLKDEEDEKLMPRWTEADEKNDLKSLERKGERNLYLLVRCKPGEKYEWRFPQGDVQDNELLHEVLHFYLSAALFSTICVRPQSVIYAKSVDRI